MRLRALVVGLGIVASAAAQAAPGKAAGLGASRRKPVALIGATKLATLTPAAGFVDTPMAFDGAGGRLLYVVTDAAELCNLVVYDLAAKAEVASVDLHALVSTPIAVDFVGDGQSYLVISRAGEGEPASAVVVDGAGKVLRKFGPATDLTRITYDEQAAIAVHQTSTVKGGKAPLTRHVVDVYALDSGKRLGKRAQIDLDDTDRSKKLDFRVNHWLDGFTRAVGTVGGTYDKKEDQRSPDAEGVYDLPAATWSRREPIAEVIAHAKRFAVLAQHGNERGFLRIADDLHGLERWTDGAMTAVELAEPLAHYDGATLAYQLTADGGVLFTLKIDPVNADAVARKHADPEWLDLYQLAPGATKATRRARLKLKAGQKLRWTASAGYWAIEPAHVGFDRGGERLDLYQLAAP